MNVNELNNYPEPDNSWSDEQKMEYYRLIDELKTIHVFGDIVTKWVTNTEVLKKREDYIRLKREGKI